MLLRSLALANPPIVLPPYGELLLQPGSSFVAASAGVLDGSGQATSVFSVPLSLPAGLTGYWQGLVGAPVFFTNMEPTVLQGL